MMTSESTELYDNYHRSGFLIIRQLFTKIEIQALGEEADSLLTQTELMEADNIRCRWQDDVRTGQCTFDCFDPVIDLGPICGQIARSPKLLNVLREIYNEEAHLFKDKLIFKRPGTKGYALHQDYIAWDSFPESFLTVVVPIDAADRHNGAIEVFPGLHRQGYLSPRDGNYHELPLQSVQGVEGVFLELEPGDIAIFGGFTPHRSAPNVSDRPRRQLYLSYNKHSDGGDRRESHYGEFQTWLKAKYAEYGKHQVYFR